MSFKIIDDEMKEQEETLSAIRKRHHHDDGSEVALSIIDETKSIERKLLEEENLWKLRTQHPERQKATTAQSESNNNQKRQLPDEQPQAKRQRKEIMASCNCGKSFAAEKDSSTIRITAFDSSGNVSGTYSVSADSGKAYGVSGQQKESYSVSGSNKENYS